MIVGNRHRRILRDNIYGIKNCQLRRMAVDVGIHKLKASAYDSLRESLHKFMKIQVKMMMDKMYKDRRKRVCLADLHGSIKVSLHDPKSYFQHLPFKRLVVEISQKICTTDIQFSNAIFGPFQELCEQHVFAVLKQQF